MISLGICSLSVGSDIIGVAEFVLFRIGTKLASLFVAVFWVAVVDGKLRSPGCWVDARKSEVEGETRRFEAVL